MNKGSRVARVLVTDAMHDAFSSACKFRDDLLIHLQSVLTVRFLKMVEYLLQEMAAMQHSCSQVGWIEK